MCRRLAEKLASVLADRQILRDPDLLRSYESDWTGRYQGHAALVLLPTRTEEVAAAMRICHDLDVEVVAQGGNSGLVGGGVPRDGQVVMSLSRMQNMQPVDEAAMQVVADAGVPLSRLQTHVRAHGLDVGIDFAARDTATLGGIAATNAGGTRVVRYGTARRHIAGLEAVLPDGQVVTRLSGMPKDNVGYDLRHLLIGSEGTLAVITRLQVQLHPIVRHRATALLAVDSLDRAVTLTSRLCRDLEDLESLEVFFRDGVELVRRHHSLPLPIAGDRPVYLLVECAGRHDPTDALLEWLEREPEAADAVMAVDEKDRARLWRYREAHTEAINAHGVPIKLDVSVPLAGIADFERRLRAVRAASFPELMMVLFGHLAEGNLHINLVGEPASPEDAVVEEILRLVADCDGSIGAEHGVGQAKSRWITLSRSRSEIAVMRAVKQALDPRGVLNPGILFPPTSVQA